MNSKKKKVQTEKSMQENIKRIPLLPMEALATVSTPCTAYANFQNPQTTCKILKRGSAHTSLGIVIELFILPVAIVINQTCRSLTVLYPKVLSSKHFALNIPTAAFLSLYTWNKCW